MAICQDPAIPRWTRVPQPYTRADAEGWVAGVELEAAAGTAMNWLAVDEDDDVLASVAVQDIREDEGTGEIGYWVAAHARGRGIATRAVRLATDWALGELGLKTLEIMTHEDNTASQGVARAAGYVETGETSGARGLATVPPASRTAARAPGAAYASVFIAGLRPA